MNIGSDVAATTSVSPRTFLGHPIGLATLFFVEMWERMSFYGMRALLILYLVEQTARGGLGLDDRTASSIYGLYVGGSYLASLPGGWVGDRLLGSQRAVLIGGIIIALGHVVLGIAPGKQIFFLGLLIIVLGTGLLKTNASMIVAQLYPEGGSRRDAGYTLYYIGVNAGATIGPLISGWLALRYGWAAGFMSTTVGMTAGVVQYLWNRRWLANAGLAPTGGPPGAGSVRVALVGAAALALLVVLFFAGVIHVDANVLAGMTTQVVVGLALLFFAYLLFGAKLTRIERQRVGVLLVLFVVASLFWAGEEQAGASLNLFAERYTQRHLWNFEVPAAWFQSLDAFYIIAFGGVFSALWLALGRRQRDPSTGGKFALAMLLIAAAFAVMVAASRLLVSSGHRVGMGWLAVTYLLIVWGELCLSPVGLSAVTKLVPARFVGQSLGIFLFSISLGDLLAGRISGGFDPNNLAGMPGLFLFVCGFCAVSGALLIVLLPLLRRWSRGVT